MKDKKDYLEELEFASCPTEEKEPFFWRWTEEGKETLNNFVSKEIEQARKEGYERGKKEGMIVERIGWVKGERCINCGKPKKVNLTDMCGRCLETQ